MGQLLSHPLTEKTIEYNDYKQFNRITESSDCDGVLSVPRYFNCVGSMQGYRLTQEDAHLIINENRHSDIVYVKFYNPFENKQDNLKLSIFGVFDGHGNDECSNTLSGNHMKRHGKSPPNSTGSSHSKHEKLNNILSSSTPTSELMRRGLAKWIVFNFEHHQYGAQDITIEGKSFKRNFRTLEGLITQVLKDSFLLEDQELHKYFSRNSCGSTAVVAIIINDTNLYVANSGDSRCILASKSNGIKTMSFDHKPQHIGELLRINDNGGTVSLGRVGGVLALSRAFGDFQFKRNVVYNSKFKVEGTHVKNNNTGLTEFVGTPPQESQVTVEPDILMHKINYLRDEFLVLACDGIWDIYSNKQVTKFIKYHLTLGMKLDTIMTKLLDHGIAQANSDTGIGFDNMTAIIIVLNKPGESLSDWHAKMKSRLEREKGLQ